MRGTLLTGLVAASLVLGHHACLADGCFVFRWNKELDINEPTQKAIILHDHGREDLVLQVKYEGPAEEFGWLVPVPGLPEVRKGSMDCFYELSLLTQRQFGGYGGYGGGGMAMGMRGSHAVNVIEIETVGSYEVAVLAAGDSGKLAEWLEANHFVFPQKLPNILDYYVKKNWYFVAIKIDPDQNDFVLLKGSPKKGVVRKTVGKSTREKLANGELHPLIISFDSEKCVFPLAISAVNGTPSEISLHVLSAEPLMSRTIFDKKFAAYLKDRANWIEDRSHDREAMDEERDQKMAERMAEAEKRFGTNSARVRRFANWTDDPADPRPSFSVLRRLREAEAPLRDGPNFEFGWPGELLQSMETYPAYLMACTKELPRLADKSWYLTKQVETFQPDEMRDLEFEPVIPVLAEKLRTAEGDAVGLCLGQIGARALPSVISAAKSPDSNERRNASSALECMVNVNQPAVILALLKDDDARTRLHAIYAAGNNWDASFAPRLVQMFGDSDPEVRRAAQFIMGQHPDDSLRPIYRKMVEEDGAAAAEAITLIDPASFSRSELIHLFCSTNLPVVSTAFSRLRYTLTVDEVAPLLTNALPMARMMGLGELRRIGDTQAVGRILSLLHDSNEAIRWTARSDLRRFSGQKLGADPAAYEKWWAENKGTFVAKPQEFDQFGRPLE